jgi:hypothetical protein
MKNQELRVDLTNFEEEKAYALYSTFQIGDESTKYKLTVSGYSGTLGECVAYFTQNCIRHIKHKRQETLVQAPKSWTGTFWE